MSSHKPEPVDINLLEEMGYERTDVNVGTLSKSAIVFFIASTLIMLAGLGSMWIMAPQLTFGPPKEKLQERVNKPGPEQPLIQSNATTLMDMREFMAQQKTAISGYHWTDRKKGFVSIPIDEAMKKVAAEGLPTRAKPASPGDAK